MVANDRADSDFVASDHFRSECHSGPPAVGAEAEQGSMMWLDQEADLAVDPADQRIQSIDGDVDHGLAAAALQMGMRSGCSVVS